MNWMNNHFDHPYPSESEKEELATETKLTLSQVSNWFVNARVRFWKPKVDSSVETSFEQSGIRGEPSMQCKDSVLTDHSKVKKAVLDLKLSNANRINPNNANVTRTNIVGSLPNGLPTPTMVICRGNLPKEAVDCLQQWLFDNFHHPYPSDAEKDVLAEETNLSLTQVNNWFINARRRIWKPILDKMKSNGVDKDNLDYTSLSELAMQYFKNQKPADSLGGNTKKRSSKSMQQETTDQFQSPQTKKLKNDEAESLKSFEKEKFTKQSCREFMLRILNLCHHNQLLEQEICLAQDKFCKVISDLTSRNFQLQQAISKLSKKQEEIKQNQKQIQEYIEKKNKGVTNSFLIQELGINK